MAEWIRADERLPEQDDSGYSERVLVATRSQKGIKNITIASHSKHGWHGSGSMSGVIAWQPLPGMFEEEP